MPYLAFDLDAMDKAPNVGRAAGIPEDAVLAGLARMWRHCWQEKTDQVDGLAVRGFFGSDATAALVTFRFLESRDGGFRVRGAERYLRISKGLSEGGKKSAGNLRRGILRAVTDPSFPAIEVAGGGLEGSRETSPAPPRLQPETSRDSSPALPPNIEHRALSIEHRPPPEPAVAEAELAGDGEGNFPPTGLGFCGWWNSERSLRGLTREEFHVPTVAEWADTASAEVGLEKLQEAVRSYFADEHFRGRGWSVHVFMRPTVWRPRANSPPVRTVRL